MFSRILLFRSLVVFLSYWFYISVISVVIYAPASVTAQSAQLPISSDLQLSLVQVLFRHGDRNPVNPYPNDPYKNESFWPEGLSQLTKVGKMQQFQLGQYLRKRYDGYLSAKYSPYEIYVQASDVDRTLMSAEANLAGLYPPIESGTPWKSDLDWQPIPVHTESIQYDNKLKMSAPCPYYESIYKDFLTNSPIMKTVNEENKALYEYLEKNAGRNIRSPEDVDYLFDTLYIEHRYNYTLPEWTNKVFPNPMHNLTAFSFAMLTYTTEMQRLKGGPLLKEMIQNMQDRSSDKMDKRKRMFMYSAHDTTVSGLLNTMQVFDIQTPAYASLVTVELYKNQSSGVSLVQITFRNETGREPYVLTVPGCTSMCPLDKFVELTAPVIPVDWHQECQRGIYFSFVSFSALVIAGILATMLILSIVTMAYLRHSRNNPKPPTYPYLHLQMEDEDA